MGFIDWICEKFEFLSRGKRTSELEQWLEIPIAELRAVDLTYHEFQIKKNSGKSRTIQAPNESLKKVQRTILHRLLSGLKVHPAAIGFEKGKSIVDGAKRHVGQDVVLSFDIVDFFPTISEQQVLGYFRKIGWNRSSANLLTKLVTTGGRLPQGAPTSPKLSNLVNYLMDARLTGFVEQYGGDYTRYADDITVSFPLDPRELPEITSTIMSIIFSCGYEPHYGRKLKIRRQNKRQTVTGLVVNEKVSLPRERRRWLRAVKHRAKSHWGWLENPEQAQTFAMATGKIPTINRAEFEGWLAFEKMIKQSRETRAKRSEQS